MFHHKSPDGDQGNSGSPQENRRSLKGAEGLVPPSFREQRKGVFSVMAEKHPECPLYNPVNCREYYNPSVCAVVRKDKVCKKKRKAVSASAQAQEQTVRA